MIGHLAQRRRGQRQRSRLLLPVTAEFGFRHPEAICAFFACDSGQSRGFRSGKFGGSWLHPRLDCSGAPLPFLPDPPSKATFQEGKRALLQLRRMLTFAQQRGWVTQNVATFLMPAKVPPRKMLIWEPAEVGTFLTVAAAHRLYALFFLALSYGMRVGELMGLHWDAIDEAERKLHVRHSYDTVNGLGEPKWGSFRTLELTEVTLQVLRAHRDRQQRDRAAAGPAWKEEGLVFPSSVGSYTDHSNVRQVMDRLTRQAGVTRIRVHDMRHTAASTMIQRGDDVVLVADVLGHKDPAMTLRVYSHVSKTHRQARVRDATTLYDLPAPPTEGEWKPTRIRRKVKDAPEGNAPPRKRPGKVPGGK